MGVVVGLTFLSCSTGVAPVRDDAADSTADGDVGLATPGTPPVDGGALRSDGGDSARPTSCSPYGRWLADRPLPDGATRLVIAVIRTPDGSTTVTVEDREEDIVCRCPDAVAIDLDTCALAVDVTVANSLDLSFRECFGSGLVLQATLGADTAVGVFKTFSFGPLPCAETRLFSETVPVVLRRLDSEQGGHDAEGG